MNLPPQSVAFIWDIDGVVVDSPHELAWRTVALSEPWEVAELTSEFYFTHVASRPRRAGGDNILRSNGVYERLGASTEQETAALLERFCSEKNDLLRSMVDRGEFSLFADAVTVLLRAKANGTRQASASASKNARPMLQVVPKSRVVKDVGESFGAMADDDTLHSVFDVDACGLDLEDKADILQFAARGLADLPGAVIDRFVVFEDAPSGIAAAKSLGYEAVATWRIGDESALLDAGADEVVRDLRELDLNRLSREGTA